MKVYKSLDEKVNHILDNVICDLHPHHRARMHDGLMSEDLKINDLIKKARTLLLPTEEKPIGRYYWLARGWSVSVAQAKIVEARKKKKLKLSPFSAGFWLSKINPDTGEMFTVEEADFKRNSLRPIRSEYWLIRGHSIEEAERLAKDTKKKNNELGANSVKNRDKSEIKSFSPRCVEYWEVRGYSAEDALAAVKESQTTFSLQKCIKKHGEDEGQIVWQARQNKWLDNLNSKSFEEKERINRDKVWKSGNISRISQELFGNLPFVGSRWGNRRADNLGEQMIKLCGKNVMVDYAYQNKIIEFFGDYWHANPRKYKENDTIQTRKAGKITAAQIWESDKNRLAALKQQGYKVLVIWESDFKENKEREIQKCINFLTR